MRVAGLQPLINHASPRPASAPIDIAVVEELFAGLHDRPGRLAGDLLSGRSAGLGGVSTEEPVNESFDQPHPSEEFPIDVDVQHRLDNLVRAYRVQGHRVARIDPLELAPDTSPELDPAYYGLSPRDMDRKISPKTLSGCLLDTPREVIERLRETYTRSIGVQFMHIDDLGYASGSSSGWNPSAIVSTSHWHASCES